MPTGSLTITTADDLALEGEFAAPDGPVRAGVVLCHPHPQFGGTMRSIVISTLFRDLPLVGVAAVRFNFRGVEGSAGTYDEGLGEQRDAEAALDALAARAADGTPLVMVGWSFGGGIALSVTDPRLRGWVGIAPAIRYGTDRTVGADPRPKLVIIGAHDAVITPDAIESRITGWTATRAATIAGADHYFVGRTDAVLTLVDAFLTADV